MTLDFAVDYPGQPRRTITVHSTDHDWRPAVFRALRQAGYELDRVTGCVRVNPRKKTRR